MLEVQLKKYILPKNLLISICKETPALSCNVWVQNYILKPLLTSSMVTPLWG